MLLKSKMLKQEHAKAVHKFSTDGVLSMAASQESSKAIKAIEQMAKQLG